MGEIKDFRQYGLWHLFEDAVGEYEIFYLSPRRDAMSHHGWTVMRSGRFFASYGPSLDLKQVHERMNRKIENHTKQKTNF